ncbi:MAG: triphosphoribosyl-dephospho-CoA synthase [Candidatus Lokiarchaeota archaeon]|nr:triphosphoribosyl-dephospho-CoA synthase [Candidatus Lokiarchaeota archaeon]
MSIPHFITIDSFEDVVRCANLASLLELSGHPKPGNVHRTRDFPKTRFEHFLAGIAAIVPSYFTLCKNVEKIMESGEKTDFSQIHLGAFFKDATTHMMKWQKGGNVLLGHVLILGPLVAACIACIKTNSTSIEEFSKIVSQIIECATLEDTILLYEAINTCEPGGLGTSEHYDLNNQNSIKELEENNVTLKEIFMYSRERDLIASEYSSGFEIILKEGFPYYVAEFNRTNDVNITTVHTYLKILSKHNDSLVIRKTGIEAAQNLSEKASEILEKGGILSKEGLKLTKKLDLELQECKGKLNPGTTADLIAGVLFCALIFGLKF